MPNLPPITTADILARYQTPMGLLPSASDPTQRPIPPGIIKSPRSANRPTKADADRNRQDGQSRAQAEREYTPDSVLKSQEQMAQYFQRLPNADVVGGGGLASAAGWAGNIGKGFLSTYLPRQAEERAKENQRIESEANRAALAAGTNKDVAAAYAAGSPTQQSRGVDLMVAERSKAADRESELAKQMALFEYQKKLQQDLAQQEQERNFKLLERLAPNAQLGAGAAQPQQQAPAGAPVSPAPTAAAPGAVAPNPNQEFANQLLPPMARQDISPQQKATVALVFGDKGKAIDALNEKGEKFTEVQTKDASFAERMLRAEAGLREVVPTDKAGKFMKYDPTNPLFRFLPDWNVTNSAEWQQFNRNAREGIAAILRKDTGAAVTPEEWSWYFPMYYPQPGDSADVVRDKQAARIAVANGLRGASGPAFDRMFPKFNDQLRERLLTKGADLTPKAPTGQPEAQPGGMPAGWKIEKVTP